jgi:hypothetical protein
VTLTCKWSFVFIHTTLVRGSTLFLHLQLTAPSASMADLYGLTIRLYISKDTRTLIWEVHGSAGGTQPQESQLQHNPPMGIYQSSIPDLGQTEMGLRVGWWWWSAATAEKKGQSGTHGIRRRRFTPMVPIQVSLRVRGGGSAIMAPNFNNLPTQNVIR